MSLTPVDQNDLEEEEELDIITEQLVTTEEGDITENLEDDFEDDEQDNEVGDALDEDDVDNASQKVVPSLPGSVRGSLGSSQNEEDNYYDDERESQGQDEFTADEITASEEEGESEWIEFLKHPGSIEDFMEDLDIEVQSAKSSKSSINILDLDLTLPEAAVFAEHIIQLLEEDLAAYVEKTGVKFPEPLSKSQLKKLRRGLNENDSASSFDSALSDILPGEPSKVRLTYEKGISVFPNVSLLKVSPEDQQDKSIQVNLHRTRKKTPVTKFNRYAQTLDMTFIPMETALLIFKQMYPQMDDFKIKEPPSRKASEDNAISLAVSADPNIDSKRKGPQIISLTNKKQLLQPLMDDYHKEERFWTGSTFFGEYRNRQVFKGRYDHPTGVKIESEFYDGHFESQNHFGLVSYPRGDTFEGDWKHGRYQSGQITFCDGLKFAASDWKYCEPPDRRFKVERYYGIKPAGATLFSDQYPAPTIPPGKYDVGDGYFDPKTQNIRGYDGFLLRQATDNEKSWIEKRCRKAHDSIEHVAPNFLLERIPGSYVDTQRRIPLTKKHYH